METVLILRHTVPAAQIASVRNRYPQIIDLSAILILHISSSLPLKNFAILPNDILSHNFHFFQNPGAFFFPPLQKENKAYIIAASVYTGTVFIDKEI